MGDNVPIVGENVAYFPVLGEFTIAKVIAVTFWDLVDLELSPGVILRNVRREIVLGDGTIVTRAGRFARLYDR